MEKLSLFSPVKRSDHSPQLWLYSEQFNCWIPFRDTEKLMQFHTLQQ